MGDIRSSVRLSKPETSPFHSMKCGCEKALLRWPSAMAEKPNLRRRRVNRPAILLYCTLDTGASFLQIVHVHGGMNLDMRIESQKPGLGHGGNLRGILQVEEDETASLAMLVRKISCLGLEVTQNRIDSLGQTAIANRSIPGFDRDQYLEQTAHRRTSGVESSPGLGMGQPGVSFNPQLFPFLVDQCFGFFVHQDFVGPGTGESFGRPFASSVDAHLRSVVGQA